MSTSHPPAAIRESETASPGARPVQTGVGSARPMAVALIDNGSREPAAHRNLRTMADVLARRAGVAVAAVSWRYSDRIPAAQLGGDPARTLEPWVRAQRAAGIRNFLFVPFFISAQGAIGSALRGDLETLSAETGGFEFSFTPGLAGALGTIAAGSVRETIAEFGLDRPPVIVVDHGSPSPASAALRDSVASDVREALGDRAGRVATASLESREGPQYAFSRPLLSERLAEAGFDSGDVVVAPLLLSPGRHAGPDGDLARIARDAEARSPGLRCRFTGLVGTHPLAIETLCHNLVSSLA